MAKLFCKHNWEKLGVFMPQAAPFDLLNKHHASKQVHICITCGKTRVV